ncbi:unnamed protein product [Leptidea sinapis]|uniref:FLYWCH-type domain-containing protein n=1 Tax=Leptidea sinapis TaxID=189913 RepID=A0A5E4Q084_9NEOP|nr:unnamed protein product [Leptidea sinapis]
MYDINMSKCLKKCYIFVIRVLCIRLLCNAADDILNSFIETIDRLSCYGGAFKFVKSQKGKQLILKDGYTYYLRKTEYTRAGVRQRWKCSTSAVRRCPGSLITIDEEIIKKNELHNHDAVSRSQADTEEVLGRALPGHMIPRMSD